MRRIKRLSAIPVALALTALVTSVVAAGVGDHDTPIKSCFGIASGQRASTVGDTGTHASSFDEPRLGIGNLVFRILGFSSTARRVPCSPASTSSPPPAGTDQLCPAASRREALPEGGGQTGGSDVHGKRKILAQT